MEIFYGIWTPGLGWLKANNEPVAFELKEVATDTAKRMGNGAEARYIDDSLAALENQLLEAERNKKGIFRRKHGISQST